MKFVDELYGACTPFSGVEAFEDVFKKGEIKIYRLTELPNGK